MGLRRSFLQSGARTLITSLWKVPDEQTKELMISFYERKLSGIRTSQALREAMLQMRHKRMKKSGAAHPYYWGAFIVAGEDPRP